MIYSNKFSSSFAYKVLIVCQRLILDVNYLIAAMHFETGGTFASDICNGGKRWSQLSEQQRAKKAVGLIQFMPKTAQALGTTSAALATMAPEAQLDFVEKFFLPAKGKLKTLEDVYMWILWPRAKGQPLDYVLFQEGTQAYEQNSGLDLDHDGDVEKQEAAAKVRAIYERGLRQLEKRG